MSNHAFIKRKNKFTLIEIINHIKVINFFRFENKFQIQKDKFETIILDYNNKLVQEFYFSKNKITMPWPMGVWETYIHVAFKHELAKHFNAYIIDESDNLKYAANPRKYPSLKIWLESKYSKSPNKSDRIDHDLEFVPKEFINL